MKRRTLYVLAAAVALLALPVWLAAFVFRPLELAASPTEFSIKRGSTLRGATRQVVDAGVNMPEWAFNLLARLSANESRIKAGSYQVQAGVTPWQLLRKITQGDFALLEILFVEGWTFRQMRAALDAAEGVQHDAAGLSDAEVMARIGAPGLAPEGMFFPDTYLFGKGESDLVILARAHQAMQKQLQAAWEKRASDVPLSSPYEALILASIVEKETGQSDERRLVAGVYANRLRAGMRLQADPTVIYGLGRDFDGNIKKRHLAADTPFNTYTRTGLPPHPIAMPGQAALMAAVNPARSPAMYFVARGDGTSEFSYSLEDHNRAVAKYQKKPR